MTDPTPLNPGSDAAVALGCICPVVDNARGKGLPGGSFWITAGCPVHDPYDTGEDQ